MPHSTRPYGGFSSVLRGVALLGVLVAVLAGVIALIFSAGLLRMIASDTAPDASAASADGANSAQPSAQTPTTTPKPAPATRPAAVPVPPPPPTKPRTSAELIRVDDTSAGQWAGHYGKAGYYMAMPGSPAALPPGVDLGVGGKLYLWDKQTTDARALSVPQDPARRTAGQWFDWNAFTLDLNVRDPGKSYQVALYLLDWDSDGRVQRLDVTDAKTGEVLLTRTDDQFVKGRYVLLRLAGHVALRFTHTGGSNCTLSGIFLDDPEPVK